jgi:probable HAF family extracellular repeat protein
VPGASFTQARGINGAGQIVGSFTDIAAAPHGFLNTGGSFTQLDVPGASFTQAFGINDAGQIVGIFTNSTGTHSFLDTGGSFTQLDVPGAMYTDAFGINDAGEIVGLFSSSTGTHGFLATPGTAVPDPATLTLLSIGLTGLGILRRRATSLNRR